MDDPDFDPVEDALERSPWCVLVPVDGAPLDPNIIGPFASFQEAKRWLPNYAGAALRQMASPELEVLCHREWQEAEAWKRPRN